MVIDTYLDHRMAMALAVAGARLPNVVIKDPACVAKTYPGFFADFMAHLSKVTGKRIRWFPAESYAAQVEAMRSGR